MECVRCAGCEKPIVERFYLTAIDRCWHDECLRCACCHCRLAELSGTFYQRRSMLLCWRDYIRLFGRQGQCALCWRTIALTEWTMRAANWLYHLECFVCVECGESFCVGDEFRLGCDGQVICSNHFPPVSMAQPNKEQSECRR